MKLDSIRPVGTGVALNGLNGNGGHEVQGVAIFLGAGHGRPARMSEGQHPFPPAGRSEFHTKPARPERGMAPASTNFETPSLTMLWRVFHIKRP
ncbi:hypothetical protein [Desulforapulum autotrophicum]|uniref:hypothetical protein n=1 Tax=Desulforapulum autotrophicum TaxID=2296 RepID=UPI001E64EE48|nr:hypothetical protein [Desulforapulum autotrophicum]